MKSCLFFILASASILTPLSASQKLDGIAAIVGSEIILNSEVDAYLLLKQQNGMIPQTIDSFALPAIRTLVLNDLVDEKVLYNHARNDSDIIVKTDEVDLAIDNHVAMICKQNNLPLEALEAELKKSQGMTLTRFRDQLRKGYLEKLYKERLQQKYLSGVSVSASDVRAFYTQYKDSLPTLGESVELYKLLIAITPTDSLRQGAQMRANAIKKRLDAGESFEKLARQFSEDPSAQNGGDLGFIEKGSLGELAFESRAFSLKPGDISDVFETHLGFHIITVDERKDQKAHIRNILISMQPTQQHVDKITFFLDSLRLACTDSASFSAAVVKYSTDSKLRSNGGAMGWVLTVNLPEALRTAFDTLAANSISTPQKGDGELSIYRVNRRVDQRPVSLQTDWAILSEKAKEISMQKKLISLVKLWRSTTLIDIR